MFEQCYWMGKFQISNKPLLNFSPYLVLMQIPLLQLHQDLSFPFWRPSTAFCKDREENFYNNLSDETNHLHGCTCVWVSTTLCICSHHTHCAMSNRLKGVTPFKTTANQIWQMSLRYGYFNTTAKSLFLYSKHVCIIFILSP